MDEPDRRAARRRLRLLASGAAALLLAGLVATRLDFEVLAAQLSALRPGLLLLALLSYLGCAACRAVRFRLLLHSVRPPLGELTAIASVHNFLNLVLPVRSGELSWPLLAQRRFGARFGEGAATLLVARLFDVIGILVFLVAALVLRRFRAGDRELLQSGALLLLLALAVLVLLLPATRLAAALVGRAIGARDGFGRRLADKADALVRHLERVRARRTALPVFLVTEAQWAFNFVTCHLVLLALGVDFPFLGSLLGAIGLSVALILPINFFGSIGTFQAGWIAGFRLAGLDEDAAVASSVSAHAFILLFALVLGLLGGALLRRRPRAPA